MPIYISRRVIRPFKQIDGYSSHKSTHQRQKKQKSNSVESVTIVERLHVRSVFRSGVWRACCQLTLVALSLMFVSCSASDDDARINGETHWMKTCNDSDECADGLSCLCGVCTLSCDREETSACANAPEPSICVSDQVGDAMGCVLTSKQSLCLPQCDQLSCAPGSRCVDGGCVPNEVFSPESTLSTTSSQETSSDKNTPASVADANEAVSGTQINAELKSTIAPVLIRRTFSDSVDHQMRVTSKQGVVATLSIERIDGKKRLVSMRYEPEQGWSKPIMIDDESTAMLAQTIVVKRFKESMHLSIDTRGRTIAIWPVQRSQNGPRELWSNTYQPGVGWLTPVRLTPENVPVMGSDFAMNEDGHGMLAYTDNAAGRNRIRYTFLDMDRGWVVEEDNVAVTIPATESAVNIGVSINRVGGVLLVWDQYGTNSTGGGRYKTRATALFEPQEETASWTALDVVQRPEETSTTPSNIRAISLQDGSFFMYWGEDDTTYGRKISNEQTGEIQTIHQADSIRGTECGSTIFINWIAEKTAYSSMSSDGGQTWSDPRPHGPANTNELPQTLACLLGNKAALLRYAKRHPDSERFHTLVLTMDVYDGTDWLPEIPLKDVSFGPDYYNANPADIKGREYDQPTLRVDASGAMQILVNHTSNLKSSLFAFSIPMVDGIPTVDDSPSLPDAGGSETSTDDGVMGRLEWWSAPTSIGSETSTTDSGDYLDTGNVIATNSHQDVLATWIREKKEDPITKQLVELDIIEPEEDASPWPKRALLGRWKTNGQWQDTFLIRDIAQADVRDMHVAINDQRDVVITFVEQNKSGQGNIEQRDDRTHGILRAISYVARTESWSDLQDLGPYEKQSGETADRSGMRPNTTVDLNVSKKQATVVWVSDHDDGELHAYRRQLPFGKAHARTAARMWSTPEVYDLIAKRTDGTLPMGISKAKDPSIATSITGDFVVSWADLVQKKIWVTRYNAAGATTWAINPAIQGTESVGKHAISAIDAEGNVTVAWVVKVREAYRVYARRYHADGWQPVQLLQDDITSQTWPVKLQIALSPGGNACVSWTRYSPRDRLSSVRPAGFQVNGFAARYVHTDKLKRGWSAAKYVSEFNLATRGMITAIDDNSRVTATWYDSIARPYHIWTNTTDQDFNWSRPTVHASFRIERPMPIAVLFDNEGGESIYYGQGTGLYTSELMRRQTASHDTTLRDGSPALNPYDSLRQSSAAVNQPNPGGDVEPPENMPTSPSLPILDGTDLYYASPSDLEQAAVDILIAEDTREFAAIYAAHPEWQDLGPSDLTEIFSANDPDWEKPELWPAGNDYLRRAQLELGMSVANAEATRKTYYRARTSKVSCQRSAAQADQFFQKADVPRHGCYCPSYSCRKEPGVDERNQRHSAGICIDICRQIHSKPDNDMSTADYLWSLGESRFAIFKQCYTRARSTTPEFRYQIGTQSCTFPLTDWRPNYDVVHYQRQLNDYIGQTEIDSLTIDGDRYIDNEKGLRVSDLSALDGIEIIHGTLRVTGGDEMADKVLNLLPNLVYANRIEIFGKKAGISLTGIGSNTQAIGKSVRVNTLVIRETESLKSIGPIGVTEIGTGLVLYDNEMIDTIMIPHLKGARRIRIQSTPQLKQLSMPALVACGKLLLRDSHSFTFAKTGIGQSFPELAVLRSDSDEVPITRDAKGRIQEPVEVINDDPMDEGGIEFRHFSGDLFFPSLVSVGKIQLSELYDVTSFAMPVLENMFSIYVGDNLKIGHPMIALGQMGRPGTYIHLDPGGELRKTTHAPISKEDWQAFLERIYHVPSDEQ